MPTNYVGEIFCVARMRGSLEEFGGRGGALFAIKACLGLAYSQLKLKANLKAQLKAQMNR